MKANRNKYIDGNFLANEIRQCKYPFSFIVEGHSDIPFFRNMTIIDSCNFIDAEGKSHVIDAVNILNADANCDKLYVGVVDKDFDSIDSAPSEPVYPACVYVTDAHDREVMCMLPHVWERFYNEYFADKGKISFDDFKSGVISDARVLGYFHLANHREKWNMTIKTQRENEYMDFSSFYEKRTMNLKTYKDIAIAIQSNSGIRGFNADIVSAKMAEIEGEGIDDNMLLNGHDLCLFIIQYMKAYGNHQNTYKHDDAGRDIRIAYTVENFKTTKLYQDLMQYQNAKGIIFLK